MKRTCECGCGSTVNKRFVSGHNMRGKKRPDLRAMSGRRSPHWRGGRGFVNGYVVVYAKGHPRADRSTGRVYEHILVAERALGCPLPAGAEIHHANEDKTDNRPENLVVCQDVAYHRLLHQRARALRVSGRASNVKCRHCGEYGDPVADDMYVPAYPGRSAHHRACDRADTMARRAAKKAQQDG